MAGSQNDNVMGTGCTVGMSPDGNFPLKSDAYAHQVCQMHSSIAVTKGREAQVVITKNSALRLENAFFFVKVCRRIVVVCHRAPRGAMADQGLPQHATARYGKGSEILPEF